MSERPRRWYRDDYGLTLAGILVLMLVVAIVGGAALFASSYGVESHQCSALGERTGLQVNYDLWDQTCMVRRPDGHWQTSKQFKLEENGG